MREAVAAGLGVVALSEFGSDTRLHALEVSDAELTRVEYLACLEERRPLHAVRAFFELPGVASPEYVVLNGSAS